MVAKRRKPITEGRDNAFFVRCGICPTIVGLRPSRVNMQNLEFLVSRRWTFLH